jgi:DNA primase catalytic subunit
VFTDRDDTDGPPTKEALVQRGLADEPPAAPPDSEPYLYAWDDLNTAIEYGFELADFLHTHCEFSTTRIFYSGQGVHVYALDDDPSHRYTRQSRSFLAEYIYYDLDIPIDQAVTTDDARVLRIPRTLHTDVSRLVTEITSPEFNPRTDDRAIPPFLTQP